MEKKEEKKVRNYLEGLAENWTWKGWCRFPNYFYSPELDRVVEVFGAGSGIDHSEHHYKVLTFKESKEFLEKFCL